MYHILKKLRKSKKKFTVKAKPKHPIEQKPDWMLIIVAVISIITVFALLLLNEQQKHLFKQEKLVITEQIKQLDDQLLKAEQMLKEKQQKTKKINKKKVRVIRPGVGVHRPNPWVLDY